MRLITVAAWLLGLAVAAAASWVIWNEPTLDRYFRDDNLRFAAALAPVIIWALLPTLFPRFFASKPRAPESPRLRDQRRSVLAFLADRGMRGRRARYAVPFYLVTGPAGAGKTSLLERSEIPLSMPKTIGKATWWVGRDAVFVEATAGQEGGLADVAELLRSLRPALPINAVLLVVSPADLTLADKAEHRMVAEGVASDLREVEQVVGVASPVYLLMSKVDLVPGFREFFDRQEPQERVQPWGFPLAYRGLAGPHSFETVGKEIEDGFESLVSSMRLRHVEWLSREADSVRSGRIHGFSAQLAALKEAIRPILSAILPLESKAWNGVPLRGIFLTSARQEPLSIDALLPELSRRFAMPRIGTLPPDLGLDEEEHGYFIAGALRKAVFPETGLVLRSRRGRAFRAVQWALICGIVVLSAGLGYLVFRTFDAEVRLAARMTQAGAATASFEGPSTIERIPEVLGRLRGLDALRAELDAEPAPRYAVGLDARASLASSIAQTRRAMLRNALAPHLSALLETQLADQDAADERLLTLIDVAGEAGSPESDVLRQWLETSAGSYGEADRDVLVEEGMAAIREAGGLSVDPAYVEAARRLIAYRESLS